MNGRNVVGKIKHNECSQCNSKRQNAISQKVCNHALSSNSSTNSSPTLIISSVLWTIIIVLFQFIQGFLIVITNYFCNADNTVSDTGTRIKEMKRNEILQKKHTDIMHLKQWPNTSKMVNAFTNVDFCHGEDDVSIYGSDFSPIDSGISSRPVSRANTNETSSECTEESGMIHTSLRHRVRKKWCDKSDYEQTKLRSGTCHVSRGLTRMRHDFSATSSCLPIHRSIRQDLSITRHVARVRNAYSKRAKSAVAVVRFRKPESEIESYANNSTFYEDFKWFY